MPADTTISLARPTATMRPAARARLTAVHPLTVTATATLDFAGERVIVGRAEDASLKIEHGTVSRQHLSVEWSAGEGTHVVRDLDSRNGAAVDGTPLVDARPLADGAVVRAGSVLLIYERLEGDDADDAVARDAVPGEAARVAT